MTMTKIKIDNKTYLIDKSKDLQEELERIGIIDCYLFDDEDYYDESQEFITQEIISPDFYQNITVALVNSRDVDYNIANKELTITDQYYQYRNTIADDVRRMIDREIEKLEDDEDWNGEEIEFIYLDEYDLELVNEYNQHVDNYNQYGYLDKIEILSDERGSKIKTNIEIGKND